MEAVYTTDDSRFNYVFCYTDTTIPLDSYVTIGGVTTRMSKVYTSADGWNPSIGQPTQGVIGFNYDNINTFIFGQTFYINNSSGSFPISGYLAQTDAIAAQLSTSLETYTNTNANYWIEVTQAEYTNVANNVSGVIKTGFSDGSLSSATLSSTVQDSFEYWENYFGAGPIINTGYAWIGLAIGLATSLMPVAVKQFSGNGPCNFLTLTDIGANSLIFTTTSTMSYFILKQPTLFANQTVKLAYTNNGVSLLANPALIANNDYLKHGITTSGGCSSSRGPYSPITQALAINTIAWPI